MRMLAAAVTWSAAVAGALLLALVTGAGTATACQNPGQTCGLLGGSCCGGSTCIAAICVATPSCQGEDGVCTSSSQCCGDRICNLGTCQTRVGLGEACGPAAPCESGLSCDPLAGFRCVGSAGVDEPCGPLVSCDPGLQCTLGLRCSHDPARDGETCDVTAPCGDGLYCAAGVPQRCRPRAGLGDACGPAVPCGEGLNCDPLAGFRCVADAGANEACGPLVQCRGDLVCTAGLTCSHNPGLEGESCDIVNGCEEGAFCSPDSPTLVGQLLLGTCEAYRQLGETCTAPATDPDRVGSRCAPGTSCEPCPVDGCNGPFQCFRNANQGVITETECSFLYSPRLREASIDLGLTRTYGGGQGTDAVGAASVEFGTAYGQDGSYGCYTTACVGVNADVAAEVFAAVGFYESFDDVDGLSLTNVQEAQVPGSFVNFSTSQIFSRTEDTPIGQETRLIGTADAFSVGAGASPLPFAAGSFLCETVLDEMELDPDTLVPVPEPGIREGLCAVLAALGALRLRRRRRR